MFASLLRSHLRPYSRTLLLVLGLTVVHTTAALTLPALSADLINDGVLQGDDAYIRSVGVVMLGFTVVQLVFAAFAVYFGAKVAMAFGRDVRGNLFHRVTEFSAREVGAFGAPSLITRITNDVQQVQMVVMMGLTMFIQAPITMAVGVVMALREDVGLSVVLLVSMVIGALVLGSVISRMIPVGQAMQDRIDQVNRIMREQITGMRVVRAFVREPEEEKRFERANRDLTDTSLRSGRLMASIFPTVTLLINASTIAVLWFGADRIQANDLDIGSLIAYMTYLVQILMAVVMATFLFSMLPRATVAAGRIEEVLHTESSVASPPAPVTELVAPGTVEFRDVGFHYPGAEQPVLTDVSFTVRPGETTAIIGSTGAGKTTIVNLVARLADVTSGAVLVGGVDVRELDTAVLWQVIGLVPQRPYLFSGSVRSNLEYGRPGATEAEMWEALTVAQAADFVQAMSDGLDSPIEQGGANVSGGQRQRLSIARALVRRPLVYLFDDSFSALDMATDVRLRAALRPHTVDAATIVVAQRVSSVMDAHQIVVVEDGRVIGAGTHLELLAGCPTYAEIVDSQLGEREGVA